MSLANGAVGVMTGASLAMSMIGPWQCLTSINSAMRCAFERAAGFFVAVFDPLKSLRLGARPLNPFPLPCALRALAPRFRGRLREA